MSKKSKMKEREEASYIAPCEDVVVELPFMVKRVMRGRRPSNELCKQCMRYEYCKVRCIKLETYVIRSIQYSVLPQRLRTGSKSATAANHWEK